MDIHESAFSGKTVLVTGAAGAIGSNLCKQLAILGARVLALDDLSVSEKWNVPDVAGVNFIHADILDDSEMLAVFAERPRIVFHLAAFFANQNSVENPEKDLMLNGVGTLRMLEYARRYSVERFVYASTSAIQSAITGPANENAPRTRLTTPYQISKKLGESYCTFFSEHHALNVVKARLFNSYGPGDMPGNYRSVIPNFIYRALKKQTLPITGTGEETRDFTFVEDIVDGLVRSAFYEAAIGRELNLASGKETTTAHLAELINQTVGNPSGICYQPRRVWDQQKRRRGSIELTKEVIGYEPKTGLVEGLQHTVQWFKVNWEKIEAAARF